MKLYHRYSRFKYRRMRSHQESERIRWGAGVNPGDLINDCSGFNRVASEAELDCRMSKRGWAIIDVIFTTEPFGGSCSLIHCGVTSAIPRETIEQDYRTHYGSPEYLESVRRWYQGHPDQSAALQTIERRLALLDSGGHFLDERGVLLASEQASVI